MEVMPSWYKWDISHQISTQITVFLFVLFALFECILKYYGTVLWLNDCSSEIVRFTVKEIVIMVICVKNEWWERLKIVYIIYFIF